MTTQVLHTKQINLSPFTKDFRVWGAPIETYLFLFKSLQSDFHNKYKILELWVNFDHKYCFWQTILERVLMSLMLVQFLSVCLSVTSNRQTDRRKITEGERADGLTIRYTDN